MPFRCAAVGANEDWGKASIGVFPSSRPIHRKADSTLRHLRARTKPKARINPPCIGAEFVGGLDRQRARERQIDREIFRHPRRTGGGTGADRSGEYTSLDP